MLTFENVSIYQDKKIINGLSFDLPKGQLISMESSLNDSKLLLETILGHQVISQGKIYIMDKAHHELTSSDFLSMGIVEDDVGMYERLSVKQYMKFFQELFNARCDLKGHLSKFGLIDLMQTKLKDLSETQKKRLSFARECLKSLKLLIIFEPFRNMEQKDIRIMFEALESLKAQGVSILAFSSSYKEALYLSETIYLMNQHGLDIVQNELPVQKNAESIHIKIEKISAKAEDRTFLFNPSEIDYIESQQGISYLYVRGSKFSSNMSLSDFETQLTTYGFFRCHRSYIINLQRVKEIITWTKDSFSLVLDDKSKSTIPLSKGRITQLKQIIHI